MYEQAIIRVQYSVYKQAKEQIAKNKVAPEVITDQNNSAAKMNAAQDIIVESPNMNRDIIESCCICIDNFNDQEILAETKKCSHLFHEECLKSWVTQRVNQSIERQSRIIPDPDCPSCRQNLN